MSEKIRQQASVKIQITGPAAEAVLELVEKLQDVRTPKEAVLRAVGIVHAAIGGAVLLEDSTGDQRQVVDLWRQTSASEF